MASAVGQRRVMVPAGANMMMRWIRYVPMLLIVAGCVEVEEGVSTFGSAGPSAGPVSDGDSGGSGTDDAGTGETEVGGTSAASEDSAADDATSNGPMGMCGDGAIDEGEVCDTGNVGTETCMTQGQGAGTLTCLANCMGYDTSACAPAAGCGDGQIGAGEQCDGGNLNGQSCGSLGFDMGALGCTAMCMYDTGNCMNVACAAEFDNCTQVQCCAGLFCYPFGGNDNYCGPM